MAEDGCMQMPLYPVRKATLLKVIEETEGLEERFRLGLMGAVGVRFSGQFIGSFDLGMFLGEALADLDSADFELIHTRVRNRDILPIVGIDTE